MIFSALSLVLLAAPPQCQPVVQDLIAGQHFDIGDVTITNTGDTLRVDVELAASGIHHHDGMIWAVHIYAGSGPPPGAANCGNPVPGHFPYRTEYPLGTHHHTELIPFSDLGIACGDPVQVAVHAEVSCDLHADETAWSTGQNEFCGSRWGWWLDYDTCCTVNSSGMHLSVGPLLAGAAGNFAVDGAQAGEALTFYRSAKPIVLGGGFTSPSFGATILDLQAPVGKLGTAVANAAGVATLTVAIPLHAPSGMLLAVQAVALRLPDAAASNAVYAQLH
jgi:hypothetical protein